MATDPGERLRVPDCCSGHAVASTVCPVSAEPSEGWGGLRLDSQGHVLSMDRMAEICLGITFQSAAGRAFEALLATPPTRALPWQAPPEGSPASPGWQRWPGACLARNGERCSMSIELLIGRLVPEMQGPAGPGFLVLVHPHSGALASGLTERQLRALIELAPIAVWVAEADRVVFANRAAGKLMGLESGEALVGRSVYTLLNLSDHEELSRCVAAAVEREGQVETLQAHLLGHDQEAREVEIALAALPDHGRTTVQMVVSNISQRNRELREMQRSRQLLKRLSAHVVEAREEERRHIARELHDELGQRLGALKMDIVHCASTNSVPGNDGRVQGLLQSLDDILMSVRRIASNLRPPLLDDLGLGDAIEALAADFSRRIGIQVRLNTEPLEESLDDRVSIAAYRMVQEALTNVARHSRATRVNIELRRVAAELMLSVSDDGVGLQAAAHPQRDSQFGLLGMQERADALGGSLNVEDIAGGGVRLVVHLPVEPADTKARGPAPASNPRAA